MLEFLKHCSGISGERLWDPASSLRYSIPKGFVCSLLGKLKDAAFISSQFKTQWVGMGSLSLNYWYNWVFLFCFFLQLNQKASIQAEIVEAIRSTCSMGVCAKVQGTAWPGQFKSYLGGQKPGQVDLRHHFAAPVTLLLVTMVMILHQMPNLDTTLQVWGDHGDPGPEAIWAACVPEGRVWKRVGKNQSEAGQLPASSILQECHLPAASIQNKPALL